MYSATLSISVIGTDVSGITPTMWMGWLDAAAAA